MYLLKFCNFHNFVESATCTRYASRDNSSVCGTQYYAFKYCQLDKNFLFLVTSSKHVKERVVPTPVIGQIKSTINNKLQKN